jgi:hypothetical protein
MAVRSGQGEVRRWTCLLVRAGERSPAVLEPSDVCLETEALCFECKRCRRSLEMSMRKPEQLCLDALVLESARRLLVEESLEHVTDALGCARD